MAVEGFIVLEFPDPLCDGGFYNIEKGRRDRVLIHAEGPKALDNLRQGGRDFFAVAHGTTNGGPSGAWQRIELTMDVLQVFGKVWN